MFKRIVSLTSKITAAGATLLLPLAAGAAIREVKPEGVQENLLTVIKTVLNAIVGIAGAILIILLVIGGVRYLINAGNEEEVGKAKKLIIDAIIGLIIVLAAYAIGYYIINTALVGLGAT